MKNVNEIDAVKLKDMVKELNMNSILKKKIKTVGIKKDDLAAAFGEGCLTVQNAGKVDSLSDELVDFYNDLFGDESPEAEGKSDKKGKKKETKAAPASKPEKAKVPEKKPEKAKVPEKKKEDAKKKGFPPKEKSKLGHNVGSQSAMFDDMIIKGSTVEAMMEAAGVKRSRVEGHIKHLRKDKGIVIDEKNGIFKVKK